MAIIDSRTVLRVDASSSLPALASGDEGSLAYDWATDSARRWTGAAWAPINTAYLVMGAVAGGDTIANTSAATNFASNASLPAGILALNRGLRITARGVHSTDAVVPTNLTLAFKFGTTVLATTGAQASAVGLANRGWGVDLVLGCITTGATGTVEVQGFATLATAALTAVQWDMENTATVTIDTTIANTMQMEATWSVADTDNTITMRTFMISILGTA